MKYRKVAVAQKYISGELVLKITARGEDRKRYTFELRNQDSYFFVDEEPVFEHKLRGKVKKVVSGYYSIFGKPLWKVYTKFPKDVRELREGFNHYEADIVWTNRICIDNRLTDGFRWEEGLVIDNEVDHIKLRTWTVDIEVSAPTFDEAKPSNPKGDLVCIVCHDSYEDDYITFRLDEWKDEQAMLKAFCKYLRTADPDIITGWNIEYDVGYIMARMEKFGISLNLLSNEGYAKISKWKGGLGGNLRYRYDIKGRVIFDGLEAFKKKVNPSGKLSSYSLKSVAVNAGVPEWEDLGKRVHELWGTSEDNNDLIVKYCKKDVVATKFIMDKEKLIELSLMVCRYSGCFLDQTNSKERIIDHALLLRRGNKDEILPSRNYTVSEEPDITGAIVLQSSPGIHKNVGIFDAAALYPTIIRQFNISSETLIKQGDERHPDITITSPEGKVYQFVNAKTQPGLLPGSIVAFMEFRESFRRKKREALEIHGADSAEFKNYSMMDTATKFITTSFYGVNAFRSFRLFNEDCANAITAVGRLVILKMQEYLERGGFKVLYADTDSNFVQMGGYEDAKEVDKIIKKAINDTLTSMGVNGDGIDVKFEKFFDWIMFKIKSVAGKKVKAAKKKYVARCLYNEGPGGEMVEDDSLYIRGFETRRSDTGKFLNRMMMEFFESIDPNDLQKAVDVVRQAKTEFNGLSYMEIAMPRSVQDMDANNPWARGCRYGRDEYGIEYSSNESPRLLWLDRVTGGKPSSDVICLPSDVKLPKDCVVSYPVMFEKTVKNKFKPIFQAMGLDWKVEMEGQKTLGDWF